MFALAGRIQAEFDELEGDKKAHLKRPMIINRWGLGEAGNSGLADPASFKRK